MSDYSDQKRARVLDQMRDVFAQASLIVIPEFLDEYDSKNAYYAFYKFKTGWAAWLNSDEAPRFACSCFWRKPDGAIACRPAGESLRTEKGYRLGFR